MTPCQLPRVDVFNLFTGFPRAILAPKWYGTLRTIVTPPYAVHRSLGHAQCFNASVKNTDRLLLVPSSNFGDMSNRVLYLLMRPEWLLDVYMCVSIAMRLNLYIQE